MERPGTLCLRRRKIATLCAVLTIAACSQEVASVKDEPLNTSQAGLTDSIETGAGLSKAKAGCPILESNKWHAWLDRYTDQEQTYRLNVVAEVTMPTPGYQFAWREGPLDRRQPPSLRLFLTPTPPEGLVTQVLSTEPLEYQSMSKNREYRSIIVVCAEEVIAEIVDVQLTD